MNTIFWIPKIWWKDKYYFQSMDSEAVAELHSILKDYHCYVVERQGKTLLPQYLGLYRLNIFSGSSIDFISFSD